MPALTEMTVESKEFLFFIRKVHWYSVSMIIGIFNCHKQPDCVDKIKELSRLFTLCFIELMN